MNNSVQKLFEWSNELKNAVEQLAVKVQVPEARVRGRKK
jgi:hypothetical protein